MEVLILLTLTLITVTKGTFAARIKLAMWNSNTTREMIGPGIDSLRITIEKPYRPWLRDHVTVNFVFTACTALSSSVSL